MAGRRALFFTCLSLAAGCCHGMRPLNVNVTLDESIRDVTRTLPPVQVDVIGVSAADLPHLEQQMANVDSYFQPSNPLRASLQRGVLNLDERSPSQTFPAQDKLWGAWKAQNAEWLVILSDYPRSRPPGDPDPRRLVLPLDGCRWGDRHEVQLRLTHEGLVNQTPPGPP